MTTETIRTAAVRQVLRERRAGLGGAAASERRRAVAASDPALRATDPFDHARVALGDLVASTGAIDGALAFTGHELQVRESVHAGMAAVRWAAEADGELAAALLAGEPTWLSGFAALVLPQAPTAELLFLPFATAAGNAAALLAYPARPSFSAADLHFMRGAFGPVAAPASPLVALEQTVTAAAAASIATPTTTPAATLRPAA